MVIRLRQSALPTQEAAQDSVDRQEAPQVTVDRQVVIPLLMRYYRITFPQLLRPGCKNKLSEMVNLPHLVRPFPSFEVQGYPNCTHGAIPFFVFRACTKHPKQRSFTFSCRAMVNSFDRHSKHRHGNIQGLGGIVGCKCNLGFLGSSKQQGLEKVRVVSMNGVRDGS